MLLQLSIHHLALIDDITIEFAPGFNAVSYTHLDVYKRQYQT